jgi:fumarate reductase subunit D
MKRSNAPIFWSLFGAGGVLSALAGPVLVFITGIAVPTGIGMPSTALAYARALEFARSLGGKAALFAIIALFLWHAAHRIYHCLHDFGVHPGMATKLLLYGFAFAGSVATAAMLAMIGTH